MTAFFEMLINALAGILPDSPFQSMVDGVIYDLDFLPYLNWFVPFYQFVIFTEIWLDCIMLYYVYKAVKSIVTKYIVRKVASLSISG